MPTTATIPQTKPKPSNNKGAIDHKKAFELRYLHGLSYPEIAKQFDCTKSAVHQALQPVKEIVEDCKLYSIYHNNANQLLKLTEATLLQEMLNPAKIEKASINNLAYAYQNIRNARKGQAIGNITLTIELVFQEAESAAKKLRKSHRDIVIEPTNSTNTDGID